MSTILVINPNSSKSVTDGLLQGLRIPAGCHLEFYTGPENAPPSINDLVTANLSATACFNDLSSQGFLSKYDGFLVCCFSDHPLVHMLREAAPTKYVLGIFEAAITHSLLIGKRFAIVTTGNNPTMRCMLQDGVRMFMGGNTERFVGTMMSGLGVVELREGDRDVVERKMKEVSAQTVRELGADVIILGCAGMTGMEHLVEEGAKPNQIRVVDGAKTGVEILACMIKLSTK